MSNQASSISILSLGPDDWPVLQHVAEEVFDNPIDPAQAAAFLQDPSHFIVVALDGDLVVGFVSAVRIFHPDKQPELWLNEAGVAPSHHRRGIGRQLLQETFALGRSIGCGEAWVLTERPNGPAMGLYAAAGGAETEDDVVMFTFELGEDLN